VIGMARKAQWEKLRERSAKRFGEDSVLGEGTLGSRLAVVGEAPGEQEVEEGRPFVGNSENLLDELLEEAGIDRSKVYMTKVVKVRPTKAYARRVPSPGRDPSRSLLQRRRGEPFARYVSIEGTPVQRMPTPCYSNNIRLGGVWPHTISR
jgi:uracil-DNA glycosylase